MKAPAALTVRGLRAKGDYPPMSEKSVAPAGVQNRKADEVEDESRVPVMLPESVMGLLRSFKTQFTEPTFRTFTELFLGQVMALGPQTVCELYSASGMDGHYSRAHRFFSEAKWSADELGLALLRLIVERFVPAGARIELVADGTFWQRYGRKVHSAFWQYDPSPQPAGNKKLGYGNGWVVLGIVVRLPFAEHEICLPLLARLKSKGTKERPARNDS